jgi:hypothetical protein
MTTLERPFVPTHIIAGEPVMAYRAEGFNFNRFVNAEGKIRTTNKGGRLAVRLPDPEPEPEIVQEVVKEEINHLPVEVAAAILRAVAWPLPEEPCGYAETSNGHSATLDGKTPDGYPIVRVCMKKGNDWEWHKVVVTPTIPFWNL